MRRQALVVLVGSFLLFGFLFTGLFHSLTARQAQRDLEQTLIIQENVRDRFNLYLKLPITIALIGADYFATGDFRTVPYGPFAAELIKLNRQVLGLSLLDHTGQIIRVFPEATNPNTVGRITQNYQALLRSLERNEPFWLTPPFQLYQGPIGFGVYVPIRRNGKLQGWFAPVMSIQDFAERFKLVDYIKSFDLIIRDQETGRAYFETALHPGEEKQVYESEVELYGRKLLIQGWRKRADVNYPWYVSWLLSFGIAILVFVIWRLREARRVARGQLQDISTLLQLTSKEALGNLIDVQGHSEQKDPQITYLTNLLEQIDLLQTLAHTGSELMNEEVDLIPLMLAQLVDFNAIVTKKNLTVTVKTEKFGTAIVANNGWLLQHSVFANLLSHAIVHAQPGSTLEFEWDETEDTYFFNAKVLSITGRGALVEDRRLEVARRTLQLFRGDLILQPGLTGGVILRMKLPK